MSCSLFYLGQAGFLVLLFVIELSILESLSSSFLKASSNTVFDVKPFLAKAANESDWKKKTAPYYNLLKTLRSAGIKSEIEM